MSVGAQVMANRAATRREAVIEDVEWMVSCGEWPGRIADRMRMDVRTLARLLQRYERPDLAKTFAALAGERRYR